MKKPNLTPDEIANLDRMAQLGKLWSIEVYYFSGDEVKRVYYHNRTEDEMMAIRRNIWSAGIVESCGDKIYRVVSPLDIKDVFLCRQESYKSHV